MRYFTLTWAWVSPAFSAEMLGIAKVTWQSGDLLWHNSLGLPRLGAYWLPLSLAGLVGRGGSTLVILKARVRKFLSGFLFLLAPTPEHSINFVEKINDMI